MCVNSALPLPLGSRVVAACLCASEAAFVFQKENSKEQAPPFIVRLSSSENEDQDDYPLTACLRLLPPIHAVKLMCCNDKEVVIATLSGELYVFDQREKQQQQLRRVVMPAQGAVTKIAMGNSNTLFVLNSTAYLLSEGASQPEVVPIPERNAVILDVSAGFDFYVICTTSHTYSWGSGLYGRLGLGHTRNKPSPTLVESLEGLGNLTVAGNGVTLVSASTWHAVAITAGPDNTNEVWTWGWGRFGQFGGDNKDKMITLPTRMDEWKGDETIVQVTTGPRHTAILTAAGKVWVFGQLGPNELPTGIQPDTPPALFHTDTDIAHVRLMSSFRWGLLMV